MVFFVRAVSLVMLVLCATLARAEAPETVIGAKTVGLEQAKSLFDQGAVFIDVRDQQSWSLGHIEAR